MAAVVLAVGGNNHRFVLLVCINIVVAANAGGAFSAFGDITTLMVWQKNIQASYGAVVRRGQHSGHVRGADHDARYVRRSMDAGHPDRRRGRLDVVHRLRGWRGTHGPGARGVYTFFGHLKWTPVIAAGYVASILTHMWLNSAVF